ncbi:MAG: hypothetical protein MJ233_03470 [Mycoplasmoidaceae bacterium]|nr:hypothetical protein [Mycoplasmoidaceae bacterium]
MLASDHCCNLSLYSGHPSVKLEQKKQKKLQADASKHYVAIVMSDGDNLQ